jgi:hypothetical protein
MKLALVEAMPQHSLHHQIVQLPVVEEVPGELIIKVRAIASHGLLAISPGRPVAEQHAIHVKKEKLVHLSTSTMFKS